MIKRLKQSQVLTYLIHDGPAHFSVLRLQRKKNKHSIYFKTYFVSFGENGIFDMLYFTGDDLDKQPIFDQLYKI